MKICIRKNIFFALAVFFLIILSSVFINVLSLRPKTTQTRASEKENPNKIIGGTPASIKNWPFIVALVSKKPNYPISERQSVDRLIASDQQFCAGTVIAPRWIVTAAHCIFDMKPQDLLVIYSQDELNKTRVELKEFTVAVQKIVSATYNIDTLTPQVKKRNDIALLELDRVIPVEPIDYARTVITDGDLGIDMNTAGWGWNVVDDVNFIKVSGLREVSISLSLVDKETLQLWYMPSSHSKPKGFCHGDSGGPLVTFRDGKSYLIGISSYTTASCGYSYTFTNVGLHAGWIKSVLGGESSSKSFEK